MLRKNRNSFNVPLTYVFNYPYLYSSLLICIAFRCVVVSVLCVVVNVG